MSGSSSLGAAFEASVNFLVTVVGRLGRSAVDQAVALDHKLFMLDRTMELVNLIFPVC